MSRNRPNPFKRLRIAASVFRNITYETGEMEELIRTGKTGDAGVMPEDKALRVAAVNTCVRIISETIASLPLHVYRRMPDGGRRRDVTHPLYDLLHRAPNSWQTSFEWREMMMLHVLLRGNAFSYKSHERGTDRIIELVPMHPDKVKVEQLANYRLRYRYHTQRGVILLDQRDVLHIKGISSDGVVGRSVLEDMRHSFGVARDTDQYAGSLFRNDATPAIVLKHPGKFRDDAVQKRVRESWNQMFSGPQNARRTAILEEGMEIERLSMTANDAQFLETRRFQRTEIAGFFRVPPHMIGDVEKQTSWGTGVEQMGIGFVTYTLRSWIVRLEQRFLSDLFVAPIRYYPEFNVDGLLRGDIKSRYEAYQIGVMMSLLNPNEVRTKENMNPYEGGDTYYRQANVVPVDSSEGLEQASADEAGGTDREQEVRTVISKTPVEERPLLRSQIMDAVHEVVTRWNHNGNGLEDEHAISE